MSDRTGNFFRDQRDRLKKTQTEIAIEAGVSHAAVGAWEREENPPKLSLAPKLAEVYGVSVDRIEREIVALNRRVGEAASAK